MISSTLLNILFHIEVCANFCERAHVVAGDGRFGCNVDHPRPLSFSIWLKQDDSEGPVQMASLEGPMDLLYSSREEVVSPSQSAFGLRAYEDEGEDGEGEAPPQAEEDFGASDLGEEDWDTVRQNKGDNTIVTGGAAYVGIKYETTITRVVLIPRLGRSTTIKLRAATRCILVDGVRMLLSCHAVGG